MTAQQLRDRLGAVFDDSVWQLVSAAQVSWLHHGYGDPLADIHTLVVHETSGLTARNEAGTIFRHHFQTRQPPPPTAANPHPAPPPALDGITAQFDISGDGTVMQGMEPPRKSHHARPLNDISIGSETGHAWGNYGGNDHQGPYISDGAGHLNPQPNLAAVAPHPNKNGWVPLSGNDVNNGPDDVPGVKMWAMADGDEVVVGYWTTANYAGPWREAQRVPEMLFSEAQYRGWALFARWICESLLIPRNFPILPHKTRVTGYGLHGSPHGVLHDAASFSTIVLADELLSRSPATFGLAAGAVPTEEQLQARYNLPASIVNVGPADPHDVHASDKNSLWEQLCGLYRGVMGHGFSGDPVGDLKPDPHLHPPPPPPNVRILADHDCPGPLFDWHRFAREVWDWWWHPFDLDGVNPSTVAVTPRPYSQNSRNGSTPLLEYYWDTPPSLMTGRVTPGIHGPHSSPSTFALPEGSRVYALANGEVVAARFATGNAGVDFSLLVVRHEVFHQLDPRPAAAAPAGGLPQFANRIDYDAAPSSVYSVYVHLGRPAGMNFGAVVDANPDWLNRMIIRLQESQLGVTFRTSAPGRAIPTATWDNFPPGDLGGVNVRTSVDRTWTADHDNYAPTLQRLQRGDLTLMPAQREVTPIRVLLGDYIGDVGVIRRDAAGTHFGVRVEIVSADVISTDFTETVTDAKRLWEPVAGPAGTRHAVRYPSEWSADPTGDVLAAMTAAGVTDTAPANWWANVSLATTLHLNWPDGSSLPAGAVVHYDPYEFLPWLNARTWTSEWPKYRAPNLANPGQVPPSPIPRS